MLLKRALIVAFLLFLHAYATIDNLPSLIKQTKPAIVSIYVYNKGDELIEGGSGFFISEDVIVSSRHGKAQFLTGCKVKSVIRKFQ
jgi:hypothetical protein